MNIYLDESGDTGWIFDKPYPRGGSSRYLIIAALILPTSHDKYPGRVIRGLYSRFQWRRNREKKWTDMGTGSRNAFASAASTLLKKHPDIKCRIVVVNKARVASHLHGNENLLYNYVTKILRLTEMAKYPDVHLVSDARSIKVESAKSFDDYLQSQLLEPLDPRRVGAAFVPTRIVPVSHAETGHRLSKSALNSVIATTRPIMSKLKIDSYSSVWDAIADTPEEAANLKLRAELMHQIIAIIQANDWTQAVAAAHCGVTQPRVNDLLRGRISRFSLDGLVNIAAALGC